MKLISKVTALCIIWTISATLVNAVSEPDGEKNSNVGGHLLFRKFNLVRV